MRWLLLPLISSLLCLAELPRLGASGLVFTGNEKGELVVAQVRRGSAAELAGVRQGDIVAEADGVAARATPEFARPLLRRPAPSEAVLTLRRDSQLHRAVVRFAAPPAEAQADLVIEYGEIQVDGHRRRTLRTAPLGPGPFPVILFLPGSGCGTQESASGSSSVVQLLYALSRKGFATLRVEKTGVGDSEGPPCYSDQGGMAQEVRGYQAALAGLAAKPHRGLFLLGHSAGSTLAPLVAEGHTVQAIAVSGAMSGTFLDYAAGMRYREAGLAGRDPKASAAEHRACLERLLREKQTPAQVEAAHPNCKGKVRFDSPHVFTADWHALDLVAAWRRVPRTPVLVLHGQGDFVTSEALSRNLAKSIAGARLRILPMDHGFRAHATAREALDAEQGKAQPKPLAREAVEEIAKFFGKFATPAKPA
ncbi:MAG: alpha/beta fold hydrolase [Acidobacteria bacterium]|nr:alpha/beta fold hydrolase [Acidobacteriota bacterium]